MVDSKKLRKIIEEKGIKYNFILKRLNISYPTLRRKIDNEVDFNTSEVLELCQILALKEKEMVEIFLYNK